MLDETTVLPAGESYLAADDQPAHFTHPVRATLQFALNTDASRVAQYLPGGRLCSQVCNLGSTTASGTMWALLALTTVSWEYGSDRATGAALHGPPIGPPGDPLTLVTAGVQWDGAWTITMLPEEDQFGVSPVCSIASEGLPTPHYTGTTAVDYSMTEIAAPAREIGCLLMLQPAKTGEPSGTAWLLYRFGVLFAANAQAVRMYPALPVASLADQNLAADLAQTAS